MSHAETATEYTDFLPTKGPFGLRRPPNHHYVYAYPGDQKEGIRSRIRQGVGGPTHLDVNAEIHGHVHKAKEEPLRVGEIVLMTFVHGGKKEVWKVRIDSIHQEKQHGSTPMIIQNDPENTGYEVSGFCVELVSSESLA